MLWFPGLVKLFHKKELTTGTGGTITGVLDYLLPRLPKLLIVLADPYGSGLYNSIKYGVMYSPTEREGTRRRHQVDSLVEGIGMNRLTKNFEVGQDRIQEAVKVTDAMAVGMGRWLTQNDGFLSLCVSHVYRIIRWIKFVCQPMCCGTYCSTTGSRPQNCDLPLRLRSPSSL